MISKIIPIAFGVTFLFGCAAKDATVKNSEVKETLTSFGVAENVAECYAAEVGDVGEDNIESLADVFLDAAERCDAVADITVPTTIGSIITEDGDGDDG